MRVSFKSVCLFLLLYTGVLNAQDIDAGLRLHLDFNANMCDLTGVREEGTLLEAQYGLDRFGNCQYALCFNEYLQLAEQDVSAFNGLQDFSISLWFRTTEPGFHTILSVANATRNNEVNLNVLTNGRLASNIRNEVNVQGIRIEGNSNVADDQWHHVVMTREGSSGNTFLYVDGVQDGFKEMPLGVIEVGPGGFVFGNDQDCLAGCYASNQQFFGAVDDFRLYDRVITTEEVALLLAFTDGAVDTSERGSVKELLVCESSATLSIERPFDSFEWNTGSQSPDITVTESGQYIVTGLIKDCEYKDTINLTLGALPGLEIAAIETDLRCMAEITITAVAGFDRYVWQDGATGDTYTVTQPGTYRATGFTVCGESISNEIVIGQSALPSLQVSGVTNEISCGEVLEINASGGFVTYEWSTGDSSPDINISAPGTYEVRATDICGNVQLASFTIEAEAAPDYFIPNAFTPNGDGKNEFFEIDERLIGYSLKVVDRWGKRVFEADAYQNDWNGGDTKADSYYIIIQGPCLNQSIKTWVKILR